MSADVVESHSFKKRRPAADLTADEVELAPPNKSPKIDALEDVSHELVPTQYTSSPVKKPTRSIKESKKLHKERIFEAMKGVCYAALHILSQVATDPRKTDIDLTLLASLAQDLSKPLDDASQVIADDLFVSMLDGLKRRSVASINAAFFSLGLDSELSSHLLHRVQMEPWLNHGLQIIDPSRVGHLARSYVRDLFVMTLERATAPMEMHVFPSNSGHPVEEVTHSDDCLGISSPSIVNGFKSYHGSIRKELDVTLESIQLLDGSIVPVLRATDCQRKKMRGAICNNCRSAQNRWAVRLCRHKKAGSTEMEGDSNTLSTETN